MPRTVSPLRGIPAAAQWSRSPFHALPASFAWHRWHNHLSPNVTKEAWTPEEDALIAYWHARIGNRWAEIAKHLEGR